MLTCLIVDDEPLARQTLRSYSEEYGGLQIAGECRDARSALRLLESEQVDCMFLDINMPHISGLSLLRSLKNPPQVVLTTAYPQYAVEGFELDVTDYLVKPFGFDRFVKAVQKVKSRMNAQSSDNQVDGFMWIKSDARMYRIATSEIRYCQGKGDYVKIRLEDQSLITHQTLKGMLENLPDSQFLRIHKSWIINLDFFSYYEGNQACVDGEKIPIGAAFKEGFLRKIGA